MSGPRAARGLVALLTTSGALVAGSCTPFGTTAESASADAGADGATSAGDGGGAKSYAQTIAADMPLAHWRLGETFGALARSTVGGPTYDGKIVGGPTLGEPGALSGDTDTAVRFTAADGQVIDVGKTFDFVGLAPFSLEAWVNLSSIDGNYRHIFMKDSTSGAREEYGIFVRLETAGPSLAFERFVAGASKTAILKSAIAVPVVKGWHHVVGTYDGAVLLLYLDGAPVAKDDDTRPQLSKAGSFFFGAKSASNSTILGAIDEVAVYDHALDDAAVKRHHDLGVTGR